MNRLDLLEIAFSYYGMKEIPGEKDNPEIVSMFRALGFSRVNDDETPWCACFVNYCLMMAAYPYTGKLNARSFLEWGKGTDMPDLGDIVVFSRGKNPLLGHVAFFVREKDDLIYVLGGNQQNEVNISAYKKERLLSYRTAK